LAEGGLRTIFLEQRPMLLRLLAARLGSRADAEDALQDMWLRLDQLADRSIAQPVAFLYRVANNLATDRCIARARRAARDAAWLDGQPVADDLPDAERALLARGELRAIQAAIDAMPERMSTALRLFRIERQSQRVIADQLGISVSGVEKLLQRAYHIIHAQASPIAEDFEP
jgi:RNA polymerase sigma-70 factor (ECF subfamily)